MFLPHVQPLMLALGMLLGCAAFLLWPVIPPFWPTLLLVAGCGLWAVRAEQFALKLALLAATGLGLGWFTTGANTAWQVVRAAHIAYSAEQPVWLTGRVVAQRVDDKRVKLTLHAPRIYGFDANNQPLQGVQLRGAR
ncbi:MAG: hypothetical protein WAX89_03545, partial [Alphaproteobacteria bacterium]